MASSKSPGFLTKFLGQVTHTSTMLIDKVLDVDQQDKTENSGVKSQETQSQIRSTVKQLKQSKESQKDIWNGNSNVMETSPLQSDKKNGEKSSVKNPILETIQMHKEKTPTSGQGNQNLANSY